jgi:hypothetical protein
MLRSLTFVVLAALLAAAGCAPAGDDDTAIKSLLAASGYTSDDNAAAYGSEDSAVADGDPDPLPTTLDRTRPPFVRFRRHVRRAGITRTVNVTIPAYPGWPDTTALATITAHIHGTFFTTTDTARNHATAWRKPFHDVAVRRVLLGRDDAGWHIRKLTPLAFTTVDAAWDLRITRLTAANLVSGDTFVLTDPDTLLAKEQLPTWLPGDSVRITLELASTGDSCWAFLHHGRPRRPNGLWRHPYLKLATLTFERVWDINVETYDGPEIRPSCHDAIGWGSLYADTTAPYVAVAWGLPYVVKQTGDPYPAEE